MKQINDLAFKSRGLIGLLFLFPTGVALLFSNPIIEEGGSFDLVLDGAGWFLFFLYITFRFWAILYVGGRKDKALQTQGPYSITRNPLYFGSLCFALSTAAFFKSFSLLLMLLIVWTFYSRKVIEAEEAHLRRKFPEDFNRYCEQTPRLIPSPARYRSAPSIQIDLKAIKIEAKRLWIAALLPLSAEIMMHLRTAPWWPHWFRLP